MDIDLEDPSVYIITLVFWLLMNLCIWKNLFGLTSEYFTTTHKIIITILSLPVVFMVTNYMLNRD